MALWLTNCALGWLPFDWERFGGHLHHPHVVNPQSVWTMSSGVFQDSMDQGRRTLMAKGLPAVMMEDFVSVSRCQLLLLTQTLDCLLLSAKLSIRCPVFGLNFGSSLHENAPCLWVPLQCCWDRTWVFYVLPLFQEDGRSLQKWFPRNNPTL